VGVVPAAQAAGGVLQSGVHAGPYAPEKGVRFGGEGPFDRAGNAFDESRSHKTHTPSGNRNG
jgi:hypothetical protein